MTYTIDYAIISGKWGDIMSYETDVMRNLTLALRENNKNIEVLKYLSLELRRANELKEIELGLRKVEDYSFNQIRIITQNDDIDFGNGLKITNIIISANS